jgi:TrmH family RNA methyltransferase
MPHHFSDNLSSKKSDILADAVLPEEILKNIRIVLCRPIYGGNIGAVCRAMMNMGLTDLVITETKNFDYGEAQKMACWAGALLEARKQTNSLKDALQDCGVAYGATARLGLYRQHCKSPREWADEIIKEAVGGTKIALVFGPEDNGLNNEELGHCQRLIQIPSSERYRSLNLSHAVAICAYELFIAAGGIVKVFEKSDEAQIAMKERMFEMWEEALLKIGFMSEDKSQHMMLGIRRIFGRGKLTEDDVRIMMGVARQMKWCADELKRQKGGK